MNIKKKQIGPDDAKWLDHHYMNHWLWACEQDALEYLKTSKAMWEDLSGTAPGELSRRGYHFVTTMGAMLRVLERSVLLFPDLRATYDGAVHLLTEGKNLRDMIEHAYGGHRNYFDGNGKLQDQFVRGDENIAADATSTIITDRGHLLGNRLCVEEVLAEVQALIAVANTIAVPVANE